MQEISAVCHREQCDGNLVRHRTSRTVWKTGLKETTPVRGHELGPHFIGCLLGERRPAVHHQVIPQAIVPSRPGFVASGLGWRLKLAHEPGVGCARFHRIGQLDDDLMDVIALRTFECPDVEAGGAGADTCQHGCCLALGTLGSVNPDHDRSPWVRRERYRTLSHRWMPEGR